MKLGRKPGWRALFGICLTATAFGCAEATDPRDAPVQSEDGDSIATAQAALETDACGITVRHGGYDEYPEFSAIKGMQPTWFPKNGPAVGVLVRNGQVVCTGTLISRDLFLSARHCGWVPGDVVYFEYARKPIAGSPNVPPTENPLRTPIPVAVSTIVEQGDSATWDYAIVKLAGEPGVDFQWARVAPIDPAVGSPIGIIHAVNGERKIADAVVGPSYPSSLGTNWFRHNFYTTSHSDGAGIYNGNGYLVGLHASSGCAAGDAALGNNALRMTKLIEKSPILRALSKYEVVTTPATWENAGSDCIARGGHLVAYSEAGEHYLWAELLKTKGQTDGWVGYTDQLHEGQWNWVTGEEVGVRYANDYSSVVWSLWAPGEPNNAGGIEHVAHVHVEADITQSRLNDLSSGSLLPYICEYGDYQVRTQPANWDAANADCASLGGHLATVRHLEENRLIRQLALRSVSSGSIWLGYTDAQHEGVWHWVDGRETKYSRWRSGEPNNAGSGEHHVEMVLSDVTAGWNDNNGSIALPYVCEFTRYRYFGVARDGWGSHLCEDHVGHYAYLNNAEEARATAALATRHPLATIAKRDLRAWSHPVYAGWYQNWASGVAPDDQWPCFELSTGAALTIYTYGNATPFPMICERWDGPVESEQKLWLDGQYNSWFYTDLPGYSGGDWAPGYYKTAGYQYQRMIGISALPSTHQTGHALVSYLDGLDITKSVPVDFQLGDNMRHYALGDWDVGAHKGECGEAEAVTGLGITAARQPAVMLCTPTPAYHISGTCTARSVYDGTSWPALQDRVTPSLYADDDWAFGEYKAECAKNEVIKGISRTADTGMLHAILCCPVSPNTIVE